LLDEDITVLYADIVVLGSLFGLTLVFLHFLFGQQVEACCSEKVVTSRVVVTSGVPFA